jgi:hypothetical protein
MSEEEVTELKQQIAEDRGLIEKAAQVLGEIDRASGLRDDQADVLAALRIRVEGKERGSLEDLLSAAGEIKGKSDLGEALAGADEPTKTEWPEVEEKKREWPGL